MGNATFSGPLRVGTVREAGNGLVANTGSPVLNQTYNLGDRTGAVVGNTDITAFYLPTGAEITAVEVDTTVAFGTGTGTISVGTTSGGAELFPATAVTTAGKFTGTLTAAILAARLSVTNTSGSVPIYIRLAVGTGTLTAGTCNVKISYVQR